MTLAELHEFQRAPKVRREPSKREAQRLEKLCARIAEVEQAREAADDEDGVEALDTELDDLERKLEGVRRSLLGYSPEMKAMARAVLTLDHGGAVAVHRGLLREAEAKVLRQQQRSARQESAGGDLQEAASRPFGISDRLARQLSAHRTAALQVETARHPHVALAALVHGMSQAILQDRRQDFDLPLGVQLHEQNRLDLAASDWVDSPAAVAMREMRDGWAQKLPTDGDQLFAALLAMEQQELLSLLAVCVAPTVNAVTPRATLDQPGEQIARAVGLDMTRWWKPTAESYFGHVPKKAVLDAVNQISPSDVARLSKLKKADIVSEAARLAGGTQWIPSVLRPQGPVAGQAGAVADAGNVTEATTAAGVSSEALTA